MYSKKYTSREDVKERRRITEKKYRSRADVKEKFKKTKIKKKQTIEKKTCADYTSTSDVLTGD
jgi:hypothetical protein